MLPQILERFDGYLVEKGLRKTTQRQLIVETAFKTKEHFTADQLFDMARKKDRTTSRATVYRTLQLLVECALLRQIDLGRDAVLYDPNFVESPNHNHLICLNCERIIEFEDSHISVMEDCVSRRLGFQPANKTVRIEAHCDQLRLQGACQYHKPAKAAKNVKAAKTAKNAKKR